MREYALTFRFAAGHAAAYCRDDIVQLLHHFRHLLTVSLFHIFTAQCTLVHLRGLGIACRLSVRLSVRPSVTLVICDHIG